MDWTLWIRLGGAILIFCGVGCTDDSGVAAEADSQSLSLDDSLFTEWTETVAEWITPEWYTCENERSACGLPCEPNDMWVAINETDFQNSRSCSACMEVSASDRSVVVEVIENCGGACADGEIELSRSAFEQLGNLDDGHVDVSWRLVPCTRTGPISISFEPDSDEWWTGIQIRNPALPVDYIEVRIDTEWERLEMDGWNHFPLSANLGTGPLDIRIVAIDGQQILEANVAYLPGETVVGSGQFVVSL